MREVNNSEDILDSRDVIARRDELQEERKALACDCATCDQCAANTVCVKCGACARHSAHEDGCSGCNAEAELQEWDEENGEELKHLDAFIDEGSGEWHHGETLIRESYFEDYARELAEDIGALKDCNHWPANCIDWKQAARELRYDYTGADFDGVTYYFRS